MADLGTSMGWDDEITAEPTQFIVLKPGEYDFTIENVEKKHFDGSEKTAPCPMACVHIVIKTEEGDAHVSSNLLLNTKLAWKLAEFFESIGMKKPGEPLKPQWNLGVWTGKCQIGIREYNGNTYNEVKKFIPKESALKKLASGFSGFGS